MVENNGMHDFLQIRIRRRYSVTYLTVWKWRIHLGAGLKWESRLSL